MIGPRRPLITVWRSALPLRQLEPADEPPPAVGPPDWPDALPASIEALNEIAHELHHEGFQQ